MRQEVLELLRESTQGRPFIIIDEPLLELPEPVRCYLRWAGIVGKEAIRTVRLKQKGFLRIKDGQKWLPLTAEQYFTTNPPVSCGTPAFSLLHS